MLVQSKFILIPIIFFAFSLMPAKGAQFDLVTAKVKVSIVYARDDHKLDSIAAYLLAKDIERVSGYLPKVFDDVSQADGNVILIGTIQSKLIKNLNDNSFKQLTGKWECYALKVIPHPFKNITNALVITGSDFRGTAFGVFDLSERIGVSPWYWWADVTPVTKKELSIEIKDFNSTPPSVKYRGIFINDEDWGIQPWAAKTFEPETKDMGPKTYAKIFELLLRLKANLIWPAMHPSTKAFYHYPGNKVVAADYEIVVGSSHAEPMLRNNVDEWDEKTMGDFNYVTNKPKVYDYWEQRVKESSSNNVIYTMGMRGVHDSGIQGVKGVKETIPLLENIFSDQRDLFKKYINEDVTAVPQVFTLYKEVLDVYENGLKVPGDITLMWPDDNYGYIQRLSTAEENKRNGGSGVYYHASYWGRPHDYLWLSTSHPALIREEMTKAYELNATKIWVVNVGDIKPGEYNTQLFLDMAYHIDPFKDASYSITHLQNWLARQINKDQSVELARILWKNYDLAFERKPEFMGWSQTEPTTQTKFTEYNHTYFGDQAQQRIDKYTQLEKDVKALTSKIPAAKRDAFYELIEYPVYGAAWMNKKFLYHDKAHIYARQGRLSASHYASLSKQAYESIVKETEYYNTNLVDGKWNGMMSMIPRKLPVFQMPSFELPAVNLSDSWQVIPEGYVTLDSIEHRKNDGKMKLPTFDRYNNQQHFVDVFLSKEATVKYTVKTSATWIKVNQKQGTLLPQGMESQHRLIVEIDWTKAPSSQEARGTIEIEGDQKQFNIEVNANCAQVPELKQYNGFIESNGYVSIPAVNYSKIKNTNLSKWNVVPGLGSFGTALETSLRPDSIVLDEKHIRANPSVEYEFYNFTSATVKIQINTIPTHPLNKNFEMRYGVSIDGGPLTIQNFRTVGRSNEWKENVLRNAAIRTLTETIKPGKHTLTIYSIDPGVIIDRIFIDLGVGRSFYGFLPGTKRNSK